MNRSAQSVYLQQKTALGILKRLAAGRCRLTVRRSRDAGCLAGVQRSKLGAARRSSAAVWVTGASRQQSLRHACLSSKSVNSRTAHDQLQLWTTQVLSTMLLACQGSAGLAERNSPTGHCLYLVIYGPESLRQPADSAKLSPLLTEWQQPNDPGSQGRRHESRRSHLEKCMRFEFESWQLMLSLRMLSAPPSCTQLTCREAHALWVCGCSRSRRSRRRYS